MNPTRIIEKKRDGQLLDPAELVTFLDGYLAGRVEEYQMSAFLMAVVFQGLTPPELDAMVGAMVGSGATLDFSDLARPRVDKHSTGGVGDKVSLVLAPLAAELGVVVPMMSGRGLGHTGGTLDKLEAIPGLRTDLDLDHFRRVVTEVGCGMIGQTADIAPLDRRLYALRSVTGTVASIPLIAASIMSKKLAEGLSALVLDVKVGSGAFLPDETAALELARVMVGLGEARGVVTEALVTAMDRPLGSSVGAGLEMVEALTCLAGAGPADLRALTLELAVAMVRLGGDDRDPEVLRAEASGALDRGAALRRMERLVEAQGGDARVVADPGRIECAPVVRTVRADASGIIRSIEPRVLGDAVVAMGGGRTRLGESIDRRVGFRLQAQLGHAIRTGEPLAEVHAADSGGADLGEAALRRSFRIGDEGPSPRPLVSHRVTRTGTEVVAV